MLTLALLIGSAAVAAVLTGLLMRPGSIFYVLDHPNERSLHERPVPRAGGVAIVGTIVFGAMMLVLMHPVLPKEALIIVLVAAVVAAISFIDDRGHLPVPVRLIAHIAAAGALVAGGVSLPHFDYPGGGIALPLWLAAGVSVLFIVWMLNLYNFMDGMDGFAGGMAVFGFGTFALIGANAGAPAFSALNAVVAGAAAGFLFFNFPPARIFMGDTGSSALGLAAASMTIWGAKDGIFPFWVGLLVFSPFLVDATVTLLRRIIAREAFWRAHRSHYYQRLVQAGWGHRRTVLAEYGLMAVVVSLALGSMKASTLGQWVVLGLSIVLFVLLAFAVRRIERRHGQSARKG